MNADGVSRSVSSFERYIDCRAALWSIEIVRCSQALARNLRVHRFLELDIFVQTRSTDTSPFIATRSGPEEDFGDRVKAIV